MGPQGVAIKCSVCGHVFRSPSSEEAQAWQLKTVDGDDFVASSLGTVRTWIGEGRLHPDDQMSRSGTHWTRLGAMPEFSDAFEGFADLPAPVEPIEDSGVSVLDGLGPPPEFQLSDDPSAAVELLPMTDSGSQDVLIGLDLPDFSTEQSASTTGSGLISHALAEEVSRMGPPTDEELERAGGDGDDDALSELEASLVDKDPPRAYSEARRRVYWPIVAAAGVLAGVGLMFGISPIRARIFGVAGRMAGSSSVPMTRNVALEDAALAVRTGDGLDEALGQVRGFLRAQTADPGLVAALQLAQVNLLATRALVFAIDVAADPEHAKTREFAIKDDVEHASQLFGRVDHNLLSGDELALAQARLNMMQGASVDELLAILPPSAHGDLRWVIRGAPLWREPNAPVPPDLVDGLQGLQRRSSVASLLLVMALMRSDRVDDAKAILSGILVSHPQLDAAQALRRRLNVLAFDSGEESVAAVATTDSKSEADSGPSSAEAQANTDTSRVTESAEADPAETESADTEPANTEPVEAGSVDTESAETDGEPTPAFRVLSTDALIDRGCTLVEKRAYHDGQALLLKALDRKPNDLDVLSCLGHAQLGLGKVSAARRSFERALKRAPKFPSALRGAARVAVRTHDDEGAARYYQRLLQVHPTDTEAQRYLAKLHEHDGEEGESDP